MPLPHEMASFLQMYICWSVEKGHAGLWDLQLRSRAAWTVATLGMTGAGDTWHEANFLGISTCFYQRAMSFNFPEQKHQKITNSFWHLLTRKLSVV